MIRNASSQPAQTIDSCRAQIQALYASSPRVRVNITLGHSRMVQGAEAAIVGVYSHCFCLEETFSGTPQRHTFTYADLLTRRLEILPLN